MSLKMPIHGARGDTIGTLTLLGPSNAHCTCNISTQGVVHKPCLEPASVMLKFDGSTPDWVCAGHWPKARERSWPSILELRRMELGEVETPPHLSMDED